MSKCISGRNVLKKCISSDEAAVFYSQSTYSVIIG
jgi:hypothetical protein